MSYRNPTQNIDTKSGQYIREMQQSLAQSTVGALNEIKKQQKEAKEKEQRDLEQRRLENIKAEKAKSNLLFKYRNELNQLAINNPGIDFEETSKKLLAELGEGFDKYGTEPYGWPDEFATFVSNMNVYGTAVKNQLESNSATAQEINEIDSKGLGNYGGMDMFTRPEFRKKWDIMFETAGTPGSNILKADMTNPGGPQLTVVSYDTNGGEVGKTINTGSLVQNIRTVPNATNNILEIQNAFNSSKKVNQNREALYDSPEGTLAMVRVDFNSDQYIEDLTPNEAITLYNNKLRGYSSMESTKGSIVDFEKAGIDKVMNPEKSSWDIDQYGKINDPELEMIKKAYATMIVETKGLSKRPFDKNNEGSTVEMTYAQTEKVKTQKDRQKVFSEYAGKGTEGDRYTIPAKNNSSIQAIKKEDFDDAGNSKGEAWYLQQKSGNSFRDISPGYTDIKFLAEDLGYTIPKSASKDSKKSNDSADEGEIELEFVNGKVETVAQARARLVAQGLANLKKNMTKKD